MPNRKVIQKVGAKKVAHRTHSTPIVFVGAGNLGGAVLRSLVSKKVYSKKQIFVITASEASAQKWRQWGVSAAKADYSRLAKAEEIWLAIKPYQIAELATVLTFSISKQAQVISLLAGWKPSSLQKLLHVSRVISVMTNTAARANAGLYAVFSGAPLSTADQKKYALRFQKLGFLCGFYAEDQMPQVTALVGSAPAFLLHLERQYQRFAQDKGIVVEVAATWFAALLHSHQKLKKEPTADLDSLIQQIATPGGCTERGLAVLDESNSFYHSLDTCARKAKELGK